MKKVAALEPTGVTDTVTGTPIFVSTSARIMYRKLNPTWAKVSNKDLNSQIAKQFSDAQHDDFFKPKKPGPNLIGEVRVGSSAKFIALDYTTQVMVIAVKGNPKLSVPAPVKLPAAPVDLPKQAARDSDVKAHRGFLENHYFDLFQGMYALDQVGFDALLQAAIKAGEEPLPYLRRLHEQGADEISGIAAANLGSAGKWQMNPESQGNEIAHLYSVPAFRPS